MKRKLTEFEKHVRAWARKRVRFTERELAKLEEQIQRTTNTRDLRTLRVLRTSLTTLLESQRQWTEAHL